MVVFGLGVQLQHRADLLMTRPEMRTALPTARALQLALDSAAPGEDHSTCCRALLSWRPSGAWTQPSDRSHLAALHPPGRSGLLFSNRLQGQGRLETG